MFEFAHLWSENIPIPHHAIMASIAFALGALQLALPKGTTLHRINGYVWVVLMIGVALSSVFIHTIKLVGPFSPIHLLVPVVFVSLWFSIKAARQGDIKRHKRIMLYLYFLALVLTGAFTLLPGRVMHNVVFGI